MKVNNKLFYLFLIALFFKCKLNDANHNIIHKPKIDCKDSFEMIDDYISNKSLRHFKNDSLIMSYLIGLSTNKNCIEDIRYTSNMYLFESYLYDSRVGKINFSLDHLKNDEKINAVKSLIECSKSSSNLDCKYLLAILFINGKYVEKDSIIAYKLFNESKNIVNENRLIQNININETDFYIPKEFQY